MSNRNQHATTRASAVEAPDSLRLSKRLPRNETGRWIEGPIAPAAADLVGPTSASTEAQPGERPMAGVAEPVTDEAARPGAANAGGRRPDLEAAFPAEHSTDGDPTARQRHDTTVPLRRTDPPAGDRPGPVESAAGLIAGPMAGRGSHVPIDAPPGRHAAAAVDGTGGDTGDLSGDYSPIEEAWSREWVTRGGGDPDFGQESVEDDMASFGTDGRSFDEEELDTGAALRRNAIEWAVVLVAATLLALVLRAVLLQAFYIPSPSMEDTLLVKDRVLVNKLSYRLHDINRGDIIVFHRTAAEIELADPDDPKEIIKRVIALPGETIAIENNQVLINGQTLLEPYLGEATAMPDFGPEVVPEGHVFVMGDNRNLSSDSRGELGPIDTERVVGRAFVLFWPLNRISLL